MKVEKETLVLGVGNLLLKDEGVGIHVIKALENEKLPAHVHLMDGGTGGLHLLSWLQGYDRIIMIDATLDNNPPGTVRLIQQAQHILVVRFRPDSQRQRLGLLADRLIRQQLQDPGQLQCADGFIE